MSCHSTFSSINWWIWESWLWNRCWFECFYNIPITVSLVHHRH